MFNGVNIGPQDMAANSKLGLDGENELGGQGLSSDEPTAHGRLTPTDQAPESGLRTGLADGSGEGRVEAGLDRHSECTNGIPLGGQPEKRTSPKKIKPLNPCAETDSHSSNDDGDSSMGECVPKSIVGDRINQRLKELGWSQAELARRANLAQSTINQLINGKSRSSSHLHVIARQMGVSTAWLAGVRAADDRGIEGEETVEQSLERLGLSLIPQVELSALGEGSKRMLPVVAHIPVARGWVHEWLGRTEDRGQVYVTRPDSDEMAPTINKGDVVVLDAAETELKGQNSLWAVAYGGVGMIRRVLRHPDGSIELRADNPISPPIVAKVDDVRLIAAVVAVAKTI